MLAAGCAIAGIRDASAQSRPAREKLRRVGFLMPGALPKSIENSTLGEFARGMRELGYVEGRDYLIEWRFAEGKPERFSSAAAELVNLHVDVIVAATGQGIQAAQRATKTIPIVMVAIADPVAAGFVSSLSRPGGNVTGLSNQSADVVGKHPELLRAVAPGLSGVAVLLNPTGPSMPFLLKQIEASTSRMGLKLRRIEARNTAEIDAGFRALPRGSVGGIIVTADPLFSAHSGRIAELALKSRFPTIFWTREHVEAGGLMSYGQNNAEHYYRAANYVDRLFKGARPGDLPVELATRIELVLNRRTARALRLELPSDLIVRADRVID